MINVSNEYLEKMRFESNNYEHHYTVMNITRNLDLTELLINDNLRTSRFLRQSNGTLSPSTIELSLIAKADIPNDILLLDFHRHYKEFKNKKWKDLIYEELLSEFLVKKDDLIIVEDIFNGEKITVFTGKVQSLSKIDSFKGREIRVRIDDNTIKGHNYTFSKDYSYENFYIYKATDKQHSLLHILCTEHLEFPENKLNIQDIKTPNGEYIKIPLASFTKGTKIMEEIAEIVRSIYGNIYTLPDGTLKINTIFDKSYIQKLDLTLGNKPGNYPVLEFIENTPVHPTQNKVEVKYFNTFALEEQEVFRLNGKNSTKEDAKIIIRHNTTGRDWWRIDFKDVIEINKTPILEAYKVVESEQVNVNYVDYQLEWNQGSARVKFNNNNDYDIFIKKFAFLGKPLNKSTENSIFYTEKTDINDKNTYLKTVSYKYIVSKEQATELAKHTYYNECRDYSKVRLKTNNMPFLELEDVIKLDFKKYVGNYQIIAINQSHEDTELVLKKYSDYDSRNEFIISEVSNVDFDSRLISGYSITKEKVDNITQEINTLKEKTTALENYKYSNEIRLNNLETSNRSKVTADNVIQEINNAKNTIIKETINHNDLKKLINNLINQRKDKWIKLGKGQVFNNVNWKKVMVKAGSYLWIWSKEEIKIAGLISTEDNRQNIRVYETDNSSGYAINGYIYLHENKIDASDNYITDVWVVK